MLSLNTASPRLEKSAGDLPADRRALLSPNTPSDLASPQPRRASLTPTTSTKKLEELGFRRDSVTDTCSGWLLRAGASASSSWRPMFLVLSGTSLKEYKDEDDEHPTFTVELRQAAAATVVRSTGIIARGGINLQTFIVEAEDPSTLSHRAIRLAAIENHHTESWIDAIRRAAESDILHHEPPRDLSGKAHEAYDRVMSVFDENLSSLLWVDAKQWKEAGTQSGVRLYTHEMVKTCCLGVALIRADPAVVARKAYDASRQHAWDPSIASFDISRMGVNCVKGAVVEKGGFLRWSGDVERVHLPGGRRAPSVIITTGEGYSAALGVFSNESMKSASCVVVYVVDVCDLFAEVLGELSTPLMRAWTRRNNLRRAREALAGLTHASVLDTSSPYTVR